MSCPVPIACLRSSRPVAARAMYTRHALVGPTPSSSHHQLVYARAASSCHSWLVGHAADARPGRERCGLSAPIRPPFREGRIRPVERRIRPRTAPTGRRSPADSGPEWGRDPCEPPARRVLTRPRPTARACPQRSPGEQPSVGGGAAPARVPPRRALDAAHTPTRPHAPCAAPPRWAYPLDVTT